MKILNLDIDIKYGDKSLILPQISSISITEEIDAIDPIVAIKSTQLSNIDPKSKFIMKFENKQFNLTLVEVIDDTMIFLAKDPDFQVKQKTSYWNNTTINKLAQELKVETQTQDNKQYKDLIKHHTTNKKFLSRLIDTHPKKLILIQTMRGNFIVDYDQEKSKTEKAILSLKKGTIPVTKFDIVSTPYKQQFISNYKPVVSDMSQNKINEDEHKETETPISDITNGDSNDHTNNKISKLDLFNQLSNNLIEYQSPTTNILKLGKFYKTDWGEDELIPSILIKQDIFITPNKALITYTLAKKV